LLYFFDEYALDTDRRELRRGGGLLPVEPKVFDLLAHLIGKRDQVVSKEDLIAGVWLGRLVSDSALTSCINAARIAIGDSGEAQHLIKTLPRKKASVSWASCAGTVRQAGAAGHRRIARPLLLFLTSPRWRSCPSRTSATIPNRNRFAHGLTKTSSPDFRGCAGCK
jgi:hypothetical protein